MAIALVTGTSSGFGLLTAIELARRGDTVFASMRNPDRAVALRKEADAAGVSLEILPLDVDDRGSVDGAVAAVIERAGRIDVLVNNAAFGTHGPIEAYEDDEIARVFDTNVIGTMRVTRAVLPQMRKQRSGTIVNVGSLGGKVTQPFGGVYCMTKYAIEALSDALHFELAPFGIRVVLIEPGGFPTEFGNNRHVARNFTEGSPYAETEQRFAEALNRLPGRDTPASPQLVADAIADAAHADAPLRRYLVGQDAQLIGGLAKQLSDEDFERTIRQTLNWHD